MHLPSRRIMIRTILLIAANIILIIFLVRHIQQSRTPYEITVDEVMQSLAPRRIVLEPNPEICQKNLSLLIFVHTRTLEFDRRAEWRRNYGKLSAKYNFDIIFSLGLADQAINAKILEESRLYHDILQGDFVDTYRNITHKHLMELRYSTSEHCSNIPVIFKVDDDLAWNVQKVSEIVDRIKNSEEPAIWCKVTENVKVNRMSNQKWAIPRSRIASAVYPPYCSGMGIFYSRPSIQPILGAALGQKWLWLDDVLLTGYIRIDANVTLVNLSNEYRARTFEAGLSTFGYTSRKNTDRWFHSANQLA